MNPYNQGRSNRQTRENTPSLLQRIERLSAELKEQILLNMRCNAETLERMLEPGPHHEFSLVFDGNMIKKRIDAIIKAKQILSSQEKALAKSGVSVSINFDDRLLRKSCQSTLQSIAQTAIGAQKAIVNFQLNFSDPIVPPETHSKRKFFLKIEVPARSCAKPENVIAAIKIFIDSDGWITKHDNRTYYPLSSANSAACSAVTKELNEKRLIDDIVNYVINIAKLVETGELNGGSRKVRVLGRLRKVTVLKGKQYVTYKGEKITLAKAKKLEKAI